jgi:hypothetical protein
MIDMTPSASGVPVPYRALHTYLSGRYADVVVLTFGEIEDLLGRALPDVARVQPEWWVNEDKDHPSPQSGAWLQASRTAKANLVAGTAVFERFGG